MVVIRSGCVRVLQEVCRLPFFFGLFPYNLSNGRFTVAWWCFCMSALSLIVHCIQGVLLAQYPSQFYVVTPLIYLVYVVELISVRLTLFVTSFWLLRHRGHFDLLLSLLNRVDLFLACNGLFWRFTINYTEDCLVLGCILLLAGNHLANRSLTLWQISKIHTYYFTMAEIYVIATHFRRTIKFLSVGLSSVRRCLENFVKGKHLSSSLLEKILIQFDYLYISINIVNTIFNPQALFIIFCSFLISTANLYFFCQSIFMSESPMENFLRLGWVVVYALTAYIIVSPCRTFAKEARKFNTLLYQLMIDDKTDKIASNKKLRLHIAMKREIVFTACGFFNLDYTLIHSMVAAATTYLVILIQFGQPSTSLLSTNTPTTNTSKELFNNFTTFPSTSITTQ